jgi:FixJ family two-component response regulator
LAQHTIIVLDDDTALLRALGRLLESYGFAVGAFASIGDFIERAELNSVSCLLLDIHLKDGSGLELRRHIAHKGFQIPVIFMTADENDDLRSEAHTAGCVAYLRKPFSPDLLISAISTALRI